MKDQQITRYETRRTERTAHAITLRSARALRNEVAVNFPAAAARELAGALCGGRISHASASAIANPGAPARKNACRQPPKCSANQTNITGATNEPMRLDPNP